MPCYKDYRYCGPRCSGPGAPINQLDAICMQHDACYQRFGASPRCDQLFLNRVRPFIGQPGRIGRDATFMYRVMQQK
ncbi:Parvovirus coat protein VP1-like protein [Aquibacillus rhizosphaerae]|uniref:Parvovirus coat protein VP1-like protein n=1 Tax=Aquibacillus rhizosphaerae TaxID=3051431 RepID=A0ABT7LB75_9BACI|nr:Parvovirus coat protein VP1-like protein [Aquibacillus sp. LR5S19]MDL4843121.1 Parvovirus coat protein VP1-like protein [Aquibacillus sp. LR5S19]